MQQANAAAPNDGRIRYANYTKNVLIWYSDADAARFVNEFQQVVSSDFYWFTDPYQVPTMQAPDWLPEAGQTITTPQIRRAANYGYQIDRMRQLDAMDGKRQPIWGFVEEGWPFTQTAAEGARAITPPEMRAAVWQSIIAGARGIVYFNHSFGGPCLTQHIDRRPLLCGDPGRTDPDQLADHAARPGAQLSDGQLRLVPGSRDDRDGEVGDGQEGRRGKDASQGRNARRRRARRPPGKRCKSKKKCKKAKVHLYVFAGSAGSSVEGRFSLPCVDDATAAVVGENRTVPVRNGSFRDDFVDGNAIHIYRVDARTRCGPPRRGTVTPVVLPRGDGPAGPSRINVFRVIIAVLFIAILASFRIAHRPRRAPRWSGKRPKPARHLRMR